MPSIHRWSQPTALTGRDCRAALFVALDETSEDAGMPARGSSHDDEMYE